MGKLAQSLLYRACCGAKETDGKAQRVTVLSRRDRWEGSGVLGAQGRAPDLIREGFLEEVLNLEELKLINLLKWWEKNVLSKEQSRVENSKVESDLLKGLASHTLLRCVVRQRVG